MFQSEETNKIPKAKLIGVKELSIEFILDEGGKISVPKKYLSNSPLVQQYALKNTVVIDMREITEKKNFKGKGNHKEFYVYLDTGAKYII